LEYVRRNLSLLARQGLSDCSGREACSENTPKETSENKKGKSISLSVVTVSAVIGHIQENPDLLKEAA
jgi:hypothetical protein